MRRTVSDTSFSQPGSVATSAWHKSTWLRKSANVSLCYWDVAAASAPAAAQPCPAPSQSAAAKCPVQRASATFAAASALLEKLMTSMAPGPHGKCTTQHLKSSEKAHHRAATVSQALSKGGAHSRGSARDNGDLDSRMWPGTAA